jgi:hypothetical protein
LWNVETGQQGRTLEGHADEVNAGNRSGGGV